MMRVCTSKGDNEKSCATQGSDRKILLFGARGDFVGNVVSGVGGQHVAGRHPRLDPVVHPLLHA